MNADRNLMDRVNRLDAQLSDLSNLITALQIVCWNLSGLSLDPGSEIYELRNAVIGIADAMEART